MVRYQNNGPMEAVMRPSLSIRQRTAMGFALMILLVLVASGMGLLYTMSVERTVSAMRNGAEQIESIANLRLIRLAIAATTDNMLLTRQTSLIERRLNGEVEELNRQLDALQIQSWGENAKIIAQNRRVVDNLQVLGNNLNDVIDELTSVVQEGRWAQAQFLRHNDLASLERLFDENLDQLGANVQSDVDASVAKSLRAENLLRTYWAVTVLAALVVGSIAVFLTITSIIRPISVLVTAAQAIREGNLSQQAKVTSRDELGVLADAFNSMTVRLKQTIEDLRASEENYRGIFESAVEGIFQTSFEGRVLSANPSLARILGYDSPDELVANLTDVRQQLYVCSKDRDVFLSSILDQGAVLGREFRFYRKDRQKIWISLNARVVRDEAGAPLFFEGFITDVTERKRAEVALQQKTQELENFFTCSLDLLCIADTDGYFHRLNQEWQEVLGYRLEELEGRRFLDFVHPDDVEATQSALGALEAQQPVLNFTNRCRRKDGDYRWIEWRASPQGKRVYAAARDITERVQTEERLKELLREKDTLLAEVHHRVKNNLQVIISLLKLQAADVQDAKALAAFTDSQNRVKSMALVHERLYQSRELSRIDLADYIRELATSLLRAYATSPGAVELEVNTRDIRLGLDLAVSCGLLLNELITNSLKHAFPGGRRGRVGVELYSQNELLTLVVRDDGVGLPEQVDWQRTNSLGMQLIRTLATHDLRGTIELNRSGGTEFRITFPAEGR